MSGVQLNRKHHDDQGHNYGEYGEYRAFLLSLNEDNSASHSRLKQNLRRAIAEELTEKERLTLDLYFVEKIKMVGIAEMLEVNQSTVSRNLKRALRKLNRCLRYGAKELLDAEMATTGGVTICDD